MKKLLNPQYNIFLMTSNVLKANTESYLIIDSKIEVLTKSLMILRYII